MKMPISMRPKSAVRLEAGGPGEDEDRFDVEQDEEQGEYVVPDVRL